MSFNLGASSGNLVLLQTQVASGASTVDFINIPSIYDNLQIVAYGLNGNTGGDYGRFRISYDNGGTFLSTGDYTSTVMAWDSAGLESGFVPSETSGRWLQLLDNSAAAQSVCVTNIFGANDSSRYQIIRSQTSGAPSFYSTAIFSTAYTGSLGVLNAIQFFANTGTVSGTFKLYGIQN